MPEKNINFCFVLSLYGREIIVLESNFRNHAFAKFTRCYYGILTTTTTTTTTIIIIIIIAGISNSFYWTYMEMAPETFCWEGYAFFKRSVWLKRGFRLKLSEFEIKSWSLNPFEWLLKIFTNIGYLKNDLWLKEILSRKLPDLENKKATGTMNSVFWIYIVLNEFWNTLPSLVTLK